MSSSSPKTVLRRTARKITRPKLLQELRMQNEKTKESLAVINSQSCSSVFNLLPNPQKLKPPNVIGGTGDQWDDLLPRRCLGAVLRQGAKWRMSHQEHTHVFFMFITRLQRLNQTFLQTSGEELGHFELTPVIFCWMFATLMQKIYIYIFFSPSASP